MYKVSRLSNAVSRRGFLLGSLSVTGVASFPMAALALADSNSGVNAVPMTVVFDEQLPDARLLAANASANATQVLPLTGDRFGFGRALFGSGRPGDIVAGFCNYADALLLCDAAKDAGYQLVSEALHQGPQPLVSWLVKKR